MRIAGANFPNPLLDAQRAGELVIFAGAGVSIPSPSGYPNFKDLADQLAHEAGTSRNGSETDDRLLGRLHDGGFAVHYRVQKILSNPGSVPTSIHKSVVDLFLSPESVRLVTTNFDQHFSTVAANRFNGGVETFRAPALRLGDDFSGLVYIHGSVSESPSQLVLTDADFGAAYLTQGWARRFLLGLFQKHTVLFIGYSHSDIVLDYLARGLPPTDGPDRYTLVDAGSDLEKWNRLGITAIEYEIGHNGDKYSGLPNCLSGWVHISRMGALDHAHKIQEIVNSPPILDDEATDYLVDVLGQPSTSQLFVRSTQIARIGFGGLKNEGISIHCFRLQLPFQK